jgi:hypothetical protein
MDGGGVMQSAISPSNATMASPSTSTSPLMVGDGGISPLDRQGSHNDVAMKMSQGLLLTAMSCQKAEHKEEMDEVRRCHAVELQNAQLFFKEELRKLQQKNQADRAYFAAQYKSMHDLYTRRESADKALPSSEPAEAKRALENPAPRQEPPKVARTAPKEPPATKMVASAMKPTAQEKNQWISPGTQKAPSTGAKKVALAQSPAQKKQVPKGSPSARSQGQKRPVKKALLKAVSPKNIERVVHPKEPRARKQTDRFSYTALHGAEHRL